MPIEVELRSFITKKQYEELIEFFKKNAEYLGEDEQVSYYFDCPEDLRIQKNKSYSKMWLKKGKIHDEHREEMEVKCKREDFETLQKIFLALGYKVEIKWFRTRHSFKWKGLDVTVDFTKGYGYIIELEKLTGEEDKSEVLEMLKAKMKELKIPITPKEEFNEKYEHYKKNWEELVI